MKKAIVYLIIWFSCYSITAQHSYTTSGGEVRFNASTPLEDIDAVNNKVHAILQEESGEFAVAILIKDFDFRRKLMQEHFNENYMESEKYPKAYFRGKVLGLPGGDVSGQLVVEGLLTIHGISKSMETVATVAKKSDKIMLTSQLLIAPEDFDIEVPRILFKKIAQEVQVAIQLELVKKAGSR